MLDANNANGLYAVQPRDDGGPINVWCNNGWLVIQRRREGSENFFKTWKEYKDGFGVLEKEFWLGNTNIHRITSQGNYKLRIIMEDNYNDRLDALYENFTIASEKDDFRLHVGYFKGNGDNELSYHSGFRFSTKDEDHDESNGNCAKLHEGGWWYGNCTRSNLNGHYLGSENTTGATWGKHALKTILMRIKPMK
ncbi:angiopoietin-related protein 1-like [Gigantopelta aegis]|uniref:angiopoietin-related protein 1-like n=1 Tax=Gigantopelta aegis TaxID=1735272 RepID=UPI001B889E08|nr:angiopoietin-related protein 1-like [Gigantopelta aegis]